MNDDPNNTDDCHEQIISVSSGLPIATWCKSNIFHNYFHEEDECQNRGHRSECFRVFFLDSPLKGVGWREGKIKKDSLTQKLVSIYFYHGLMVAGKEQMILSNSHRILCFRGVCSFFFCVKLCTSL